MKPIRTDRTTSVFKLPGGTDENDLPVEHAVDEGGQAVLTSRWQPTDEERQKISEGANIELIVWGRGHPPVAVTVAEVDNGT